MKNIFVTLLLSAFVASAQTNSVKGSAEPAASALTGAESVLVIQGGATKLSSVAAIQAAPLAAIASTNNALLSVINANAAAQSSSNTLFTAQIAANGTNLLNASNTLASATSAASAKATATSNTLAAAVSVNAAAIVATSNSIAGTANAAAAAAVATFQSAGVTNGGSAILGNLIYAPADNGTNQTILLDLSKASVQTATVTNPSGNVTLLVTNFSAGQNVTLCIYNRSGGTRVVNLPGGVRNMSNGGSTLGAFYNSWVAVFNFTCFGSGATNCVMNFGVQQN